MGQKPIEGSNPSLSATRHNQFSSVSITRSRQRRSGDSNPRYGKGGSTKSPEAILDDAHASPGGRGPKARVNPSPSATRHNQFSSVSITQSWQPRSGDNARQGRPCRGEGPLQP